MVKFQYEALGHPKEEVKNDSENFQSGVSNSNELRESLSGDIFYPTQRLEILKRCCCCQSCADWPKDAWTLLLTTVLFGLITAAQFIGSIAARSLALFGDSVSMLVDVITYLSNLYAELSKASARDKKRNQLIASGFSLGILMGLSFAVVYGAIARLFRDSSKEEEIVDADIVLAFAIIGLIFDVVSCSAFWKLSRGTVRGTGDLQDSSGVQEEHSGSQINMISALLHVVSDSMRSLTTLLEAILIKYFGTNGEKTDAGAAVIVFSLIFVGGIGALRKWWGTFQSFRNHHVQLDDSEKSARVFRVSSDLRDDNEVQMGVINLRDVSPRLSRSSSGPDATGQSVDPVSGFTELTQEGSEEPTERAA